MGDGRILTADGQDVPNGSAPPWLRVVYIYGIPGAIALFAFYLLSVTVTKALADIQKDVTTLQQQHVNQERYLQAICVILAKDDTQRAWCGVGNMK